MPHVSELPLPEISLVIPTYNERENIELAVKHVYRVLRETARPFEIIVVDDDSPDRTWEAAESLCRVYPELRVVRRTNERGLASAVVRGWQEARGEILAVMDGDLQHPSETLGPLVKAIEDDGVDIAVASRHVAGGGVGRWNIIRRGVSWSATLMATWVLPGTLRTIRDPMSGYFALRRSVIEGCRLEPEGYKILLKFSAVGGSGVFVNMGMLILFTSAGLGYPQGGVIAVETAIVTNFLLNEFWTFADFSRRRPRFVSRISRFLKFNFFCAGGAVINLAILWTLTEFAGLHYLLSNLVGIGAAALWNYGMNANITWESARAERKEKRAERL